MVGFNGGRNQSPLGSNLPPRWPRWQWRRPVACPQVSTECPRTVQLRMSADSSAQHAVSRSSSSGGIFKQWTAPLGRCQTAWVELVIMRWRVRSSPPAPAQRHFLFESLAVLGMRGTISPVIGGVLRFVSDAHAGLVKAIGCCRGSKHVRLGEQRYRPDADAVTPRRGPRNQSVGRRPSDRGRHR